MSTKLLYVSAGMLMPNLVDCTVGLAAQMQQQIDTVYSYFKEEYPDLAISLAYTDAANDIAVASGNVSGRVIGTDDTFLYGSGTKPFTATAVMRLVDSGRLRPNDTVSSIINPYLTAHGKPTLEHFFGQDVSAATVLDLIRMASGIRDFEDDYAFDTWMLSPQNSSKFWDYPYDAMSFAASPENTKGTSPLYCVPGNCTAYSSTGYEVAGLVLAAVLNPDVEWFNFDLGSAVFAHRELYPSMTFPPQGNTSGVKLSDHLTTPGASLASTWEKTTIYDQNPTILGWTCGNMVASPKDVARFFYNLLDEDAAGNSTGLLSSSSRKEMTDFKALTTGWGSGYLRYGAGLMDLSYGFDYKNPQNRIKVQGHEGDTYGFVSSQGYIPSLKGAYSVVTNIDQSRPMETMVCYLLQLVSTVIGGSDTDLGCRMHELNAEMIV